VKVFQSNLTAILVTPETAVKQPPEKQHIFGFPGITICDI
jgi:hypothetical protein